jgi:putative membrane protein
MKRLLSLSLLGLLAIGLSAGCVKKNSDYSSGDTMAVTHESTTTATSTPQPSASTEMSDANIIAKLSEADSSEIVQAKYVVAHTKNSQVKGFANMMIVDHTKMMKDKQALATKLNITPAPPANDNLPAQTQSEMSALQNASDSRAMDSLYVATAVQDHQNDLSEVQQLETKAQNSDLKDALKKAEPVIQKHLDHAKMINDKMMNGGMADMKQSK